MKPNGAMQYAPEKKDELSFMYVTIIAQILLICATILLFFVYLRLDMNVATGASIIALLAGSALCWKNIVAAQAILVLCLLSIEIVLIGYFQILILPSIVFDLIAIAWLASIWNALSE